MKKPMYLCVLLLTSCIDTIEWEGQNEASRTLVVDGAITTDTTAHTIRLTRSQPVIQDSAPDPVTGADVTLGTDRVTHVLRETAPGIYQTDSSVFGVTGGTYHLRIVVENEVYEAFAEMVPLGMSPEPVKIRKNTFKPPNLPEREVMEFIYPPNFGSVRPARYRIMVWLPENVDDLVAAGYDAPRWLLNQLEKDSFIVSDSTYYLHPGLEPPAIFAYGETNESRLSVPGTRVIEEYYSMTDEHYEYVRSVLSESEWRGLGPFGYIPGNAVGNISNGAFGYFSASQVVRLDQVPEP